jgi:hypothetical protein
VWRDGDGRGQAGLDRAGLHADPPVRGPVKDSLVGIQARRNRGAPVRTRRVFGPLQVWDCIVTRIGAELCTLADLNDDSGVNLHPLLYGKCVAAARMAPIC